MAILFNCPKCQAEIQVGDQAAGKRGTCPQCRIPLIVPHITPPPRTPAPPPAAVPEPAPVEELPAFSLDAPPPAADPSELPIAARPAVLRKSRRRPGFNPAKLLFPVVCGFVLVGAILWFYREPAPNLEGTLAGVPLEDPIIPLKALTAADAGLTPPEIEAVVASLERHPERLRGAVEIDGKQLEMSIFMFRGENGAVQIDLRAGDDARFYRVDPKANKDLLAYMSKNLPALERARLKELKAGAAKFFAAYQKQLADKTPADIPALRNTAGIAVLVGGLGFQLDAVHEGQRFRCLYEDADGRLYFVLPLNIRRFEIIGREVHGETPFPGHYVVNVGKLERLPEPTKPSDIIPGGKPMDEPEESMPSDEEPTSMMAPDTP